MGVMFRRILVATDGSPTSEKAVETVLRLKLQTPEIEVAVLHVSEAPSKTMVEPSVEHSSKLIVLPDSTRMSMIREKDEILERARIIAEEMGVKVKLLNRMGDPASIIVEEAEKGGYDLIVIGGEGFGRSGRILGSVASRVINHFKGSVLVIR
ncbi:MAG: universal stress protein [Thermoproteota archaeon]